MVAAMAGDLTKAIVDDDDSRISNLPDDVICQILSKLGDTSQAARTSVLSRRWKQLWTRVSTLNFIFKSGPLYFSGIGFCEMVETSLLSYHSYGIRDFGAELGLMNINLEDYCGSSAVASAAVFKESYCGEEWSFRDLVKFLASVHSEDQDEARLDARAAAITGRYREHWRSPEFVNIVMSKYGNLQSLRDFRLLGNRGPLTQLYVARNVNEWLSRVVGPEIETIVINIWGFRFPLRLPPFPDLKKLRVLKLGMGFRFVLASDNFPLCLPSLKTLQLSHIHFETPMASSGSAMMSRFISSCPVLETLCLEWDLECHHHGAREVFDICSPTLKCLTMSICLSVMVKWHADASGSEASLATLHVTAPSLVHLSFQITCGTAQYEIGRNIDGHDGISFTYRAVGCAEHNVVQKITMTPITDLLVEIMPAVGNDVVKLSCPGDHFVNLRELQYLIISIPTRQYFPCDLLEQLPRLVSLHLIAGDSRSTRDMAIIRKPAKDKVPSCLSWRVKVIEIRGLSGVDEEIQLALAYLLKNGKVLNKLNLYFVSAANLLWISAIREKLLALERASSDCRVTIATTLK